MTQNKTNINDVKAVTGIIANYKPKGIWQIKKYA